MASYLCAKPSYGHLNFSSPFLSFNTLRINTVLNKTPSSLCLHSRNNSRRTLVVGAAAAKPLKPLNCNVPPESLPEMDVQDRKNKPLENIMAPRVVDVWKSMEKWFEKFLPPTILQILLNFGKQVEIMLEKLPWLFNSGLISTIGIGCLIWFHRDKMIGFLHPVVQYLNRYEPGIRLIVSMADKAGFWKYLGGRIKGKLAPQLLPPNSHGLTIVEKQVEDVKTMVDKSQAKVEVEVEVEVHVKIKVLDGKNRMLQKKFTATIVAEQEEVKASESDNAE